MAKLVNRAKMTTATTGTGTITLGSAVDGYQTFANAGVANADVVRYVIEDGDAWEIGTGTYTASGTTLSRTVSESSNGNAALNLTGEAVVFVTAAGQDIVQPGDNVSTLTNDAGYTTNTGTVTSVGVTAGTGITVSGSPITSSGSITVTNAAPDQVVSLTGGSNVTVTGTYPSFTVAASGTNLGYTSAASAGTVTSSTGNNATLPAATTSIAGLLTSTDKTKLDGIAAGAQVNVPTNLGYTTAASSGTVTSSTGTNATLPAATTSVAGLLTSADKTKLDGVAAGATANTGTVTSVAATAGTGISISGSPITTSGTITVTNTAPHIATNLSYTAAASNGTVNSSTGTNATLPAATTSAAGLLTSADKTKLDGIAAGAQVNVATNLGNSVNATSVTVTSSTGTNTTLPAATTSNAGVFVAADKTKLDGIQAGAQVNVATNLTYSTAATTGTVNSSTGTNATIPAATTSLAGLMTNADKTKLDGVEAGAQVNVATNLGYTTAASSGTVTSSTGTNATLPAATTSIAGLLTSADKTKLDGIAAGAQVNVPTDLSVTGGTTSGPTINSSTGTNVTIPTASGTASGVVTTNAQTFAGVKTFSSTIRVDNFGPSAGGTTYSARGIAKAWVNFDGTGTIAARDSLNVSSLTDNGTGDYSFNYTSAMANVGYSMTGLASTVYQDYRVVSTSGFETAGRVRHFTIAAAPQDSASVNASIDGDLA
jgi:hypothetical protein